MVLRPPAPGDLKNRDLYHRYMPQEWALAERFSGLEIDSTAHFQAQDYSPISFEGESKEEMTAFYPGLHPGARSGDGVSSRGELVHDLG